jgi:lipoate-protein ligase A
MLFERLIVHHDRSDRSAALNMAIDEALLEQTPLPTLRFYDWDHPALSFGYFGKCAEIAAEVTAHEIVRRWTGGGSVPHGDDLTYSLVTPASDTAGALSPGAIYGALHCAIRDALHGEGKKAELVSQPAPKISDACFANPVRHDLVADGCKIAGAAQRRTRRGFLHQGSIQLSDLSASFRTRFATELAKRVDAKEIPPATLKRAAELAEQKYGTSAWLYRW